MADSAPSPQQFVKPRRFELRVSLLFAAVFIASAVHLPYFPLWLASKGFDANQIAIALSAPLFLRLFTTPVITAVADRMAERAHMLIAVVTITLLISLGYLLLPTTFAMVLAISIVMQIFWTPHGPLVDSIALSGVRRFGVDYPALRKWGSASFLCVNVAGGVAVGYWGADSVPVMMTLGLLTAFVVCLTAPRLGRPRRPSPLSAVALRGAQGLLTRRFVLMVAAAGIITSSHGLLYSFGSIYWREVGVDERVIGVLWAFMVLCETGMLMVFSRFFGGFSATRLLALAGAAAVLRWMLFPLVVPLGAGLAGFLFCQSLHGLSSGFVLVGVQKLLADSVAEERMGAAVGAAFVANGLAMGLVTMVSGLIYSGLGAAGFQVMAAIAAVGAALLLFVSPKAPAAAAPPPNPGR